MLNTLKLKEEHTTNATEQDYILATDFTDYLVKKGESFRAAHEIVSKLVSFTLNKRKSLTELSLSEYKSFSPLFDDDIYSISVESSLVTRDNIGGTAPKQVKQALAKAKNILGDFMGGE